MPQQLRFRARAVPMSVACFLIACGGPERAPSSVRNQPAVAAPREIATNCFEIDRAALENALADWVRLAAGGKLEWLEGGHVPNLNKGKAWPAVAVSDIQNGSLYALMGFRDGDVVYAFNGYSLSGFEPFVNILSEPSLAEEMDADSSPAAVIASLWGSSAPDHLSLAVLRRGEAISINQVLAGVPATACHERPPLQEKAAEEATWTEADWRAAAERAEETDKAHAAAAAEIKAVVDGIKKVNDTTFEISSAISASRMRTALAKRAARLLPASKDGKTDGVRVYAVHPTSLYGTTSRSRRTPCTRSGGTRSRPRWADLRARAGRGADDRGGRDRAGRDRRRPAGSRRRIRRTLRAWRSPPTAVPRATP